MSSQCAGGRGCELGVTDIFVDVGVDALTVTVSGIGYTWHYCQRV